MAKITTGIDGILARLREDAHNETGQLGLYARELLALVDLRVNPPVPIPGTCVCGDATCRWPSDREAQGGGS